MKYRLLTKEELEELAEPFGRFLTKMGYTWQKWKASLHIEESEKRQLLGQFSDQVFEGILDGIEYLEYRQPHDLKVIKCYQDRIQLYGVFVEEGSDLDLTKDLSPQFIYEKLKEGAPLKFYRGEKPFDPARNIELFKWLEQGAKISKDGALFDLLSDIIEKGK